jgi:hypothetical protein
MHDMAMHDIAVHCMGVYCVNMHGTDVPGGKKPIFSARLILSLTAQVIYDLAFSMENYSKKF